MSQIDELKAYKALLDDGVITQEEFDEQKQKLMNDVTTTGTMNENTSNQKVTDNTTLLTYLGAGSAILSLLIIPILFGAGGIFCGYLLSQKGPAFKNRGVLIMILSGAFTLLGVLLGASSGGETYSIYVWE